MCRTVAVRPAITAALARSESWRYARLTQQTLDRVNQIHAADVARNENIAKNWDKLNLTVATLGARLDQTISEYVATREAITGLSARLARLEQRLEDIGTP